MTDPVAHVAQKIREALDDPFPETCSMCGAGSHTEREQTDDGEWDEDCIFRAYFDRDGNDLRRARY